MNVQLVGPISGRPNFNDANFARMKRYLESLGHEVWSPHERSQEDIAIAQAMMEQHGGGLIDARPIHHFWLRISMEKLCSGWPQAIGILDGWEDSAGALLEIATAYQLGLIVLTEDGSTLDEFKYEFSWRAT